MITNYKYVHECPENPIRNFINNSFKYNNFEKCIECCEFILNSLKLGKCHLDNDFMNLLMEKYIISKLNTQFYINENFNSVNTEINYLYTKIIKPLLDRGDNPRCFQYCEKILNYININNKNCKGDIYFSIYFCYYVSSFYVIKDKSKYIVNDIFSLCETNRDFNATYLNNKGFYDDQFKFAMIL